jgi:hypothetical protein
MLRPRLARWLVSGRDRRPAGVAASRAKPPAEPADRELLAAAAAGQQAFARGAADVAVEQFRRALARARVQDDPALVGDQAYNLAVA